MTIFLVECYRISGLSDSEQDESFIVTVEVQQLARLGGPGYMEDLLGQITALWVF
jgi:hypothetical protein